MSGYKPPPLGKTPIDKANETIKNASANLSGMIERIKNTPKSNPTSLKKAGLIAGGVAAGLAGVGAIKSKISDDKRHKNEQTEHELRTGIMDKRYDGLPEAEKIKEYEKDKQQERDLMKMTYGYTIHKKEHKEDSSGFWNGLKDVIGVGASLAPLVGKIPASAETTTTKMPVFNGKTGKASTKNIKVYDAPGKRYNGHPVSTGFRLLRHSRGGRTVITNI